MKNFQSDEELSNISEEEYVIDDPDLLDDLIEDKISDARKDDDVSKKGKFNDDFMTALEQYSDDPKSMIKYHLNWLGLPLSIFLICYYCRLIFVQINAKFPTAKIDVMPISIAIKIRYLGYLAYFLASLFYRPFVYECRNAEGPVLISGILEIYYIINNLPEKVTNETYISLLIPILIALLCFARRKPYWRLLMNPWLKDKSELIKLIQEAKKRAGLTSL